MDPQMAQHFVANGFNPDSIGGAAPVDRGALAQAVMAQQGMAPPQSGGGGMMETVYQPPGGGPIQFGGGSPQGGYALGTFQGGPDPNAPDSTVGQPYSVDPFAIGRANYQGHSPAMAPNSTAWDTAPSATTPLGSTVTTSPVTSSGMPSGTIPGATAPAGHVGNLPAGRAIDTREFNVTDIPIPGSSPILPGWTPAAPPPGNPPPGNPPPGGRAPIGTFETGPDPNAPGSTVGTPAGWGGVADPTGFGGFGAFGGFSPGMAGQGGWGGGFEGSGFNSGGSYSGGYDTAAGDVSR